MAIPDYQALMLPLLRRAASGETRVLDAEKELAELFHLTEEERFQVLPSGKQRVLHNRAHWAKFYLMKAGLLLFPRRGVFAITEAGREFLAQNPAAINVDLLRRYPAFEEFYRGSQNAPHAAGVQSPANFDTAGTTPTSTPEEQIDKAFATINSAIKTELLQRILQKSPGFFEGLIIELLLKMGYGGSRPDAAAQLGQSGDGGVDGVINEDRLGLDRVYLQAKRYAEGNVIGRPEVQKFVGSLMGMGATKGVFVTTSKFSGEAIEYARHLRERVILIDGQRLADLLTEHNVGVRLRRAVEFKQIDENFFDDDEL